jgi:2-polyprenyl-6-methoxyphenol hydroxylase-like FAD-dependent oxidoreductase
MAKQIPKYDIAIIGLGVVGSTAALLAAQLKLRVAIVEARNLSDLPVSKAGRLDAEVYRIFMQMGFRKELEELLHPLEGTQIIDRKENLLFELRHASFEGSAPIYGFYQPDLQKFLLQKIQTSYQQYIDIYSNYKAEAIEQGQHLVQIHLNRNNNFSQIQARFLLVCNGRDSLIPAQLEMPYRYFGNSYYSLNVDTLTQEEVEDPHFARTICDAELPVTQIIDQNRHQRWEFKLKENEVSEVNTPKRIRSMLEKLIPADFEIQSTYVHQFEVKLLDEWQRKRIFITGDAAHVLPPYLGLSLSAGIKDVYNLIWKISMVANHQVTGHILDYYQGEREPNVRHILNLNLWVERLFQSNWFRWIKRLKGMIPKAILQKQLSIFSRIDYGLVGSKHKERGYFFPQALVRNLQAKQLYIDEVLDERFVLLAFDENPVDAIRASQIEYLAKIQTHFIKIIPQKAEFKAEARFANLIYDEKGHLENWFKKNKARYAVLRPDRIIFDLAKNERQLKKVLKLLMKKMPIPI